MITKKSQNYGQALFECSAGEETLRNLKELADIFKEKKISDFFLSFTVSEEDKKNVLQKALKSCPSLFKNFVFVLLENKALQILPEIAESYNQLLEDKNKLCQGELLSAKPVPEDLKSELESILEKFLGKKLQLSYKEDKNLKAGIYIKAGGFVFNNTIKYQLKKFKSKGV